MTKKFEWNFFSKVPDHTQEALQRYFLYAIEPGSFLRSVLVNDLYSSVARADTWNKAALADIVSWVVENAPEGSWGHEDYYNEWLAKGPAYERFQKSMTWEILQANEYEPKDYDF